MPYLQQDPNQLNGAPSATPGSSGLGSADGAGGAFVGGGGQGATSSVAGVSNPSSANAGGYTNLLSYLGANQGAGATTGQAAENVVQSSADEARGAQDSLRTNATTDINHAASGLGVNQNEVNRINAGVSTTDPNKMAAIKAAGDEAATTGKYTGPTAETATTNPNAVSAGSDHVTYGGPTFDATSGYGGGGSTATNQANQAALAAGGTTHQKAQAAQGGHAGVSGLLDNAYNYGGAGTGARNLDAFLVGNSIAGQAAGADQQTQGGYANLNAALTKQMQDAQGTASATNAIYDADIAKAAGDQSANNAYASAIKDAQGRTAEYKPPATTTPFSDVAPAAAAPSQGTPTKTNQVIGAARDPVNTVTKFGKGAVGGGGSTNISGGAAPYVKVNYTNPFNQVAPSQAATSQAAQAGAPIQAPTPQDNGTAASNAYHNTFHVGYAHGGEIPSYSQLLNHLKGKK